VGKAFGTEIPLKNGTPAQILQFILEDSWSLNEDDKDMIVMYHKFGYELNGKQFQIDSNTVVKGENRKETNYAYMERCYSFCNKRKSYS